MNGRKKLRFSNEEVLNESDKVKQVIKGAISQLRIGKLHTTALARSEEGKRQLRRRIV